MEDLESENARLRARVEELEAALARATSTAAQSGAEDPSDASSAHSHHFLLSLINHAPNLIFIKDLNHRYVVANKLCAAYAKIRPEDFVGRTEHDIFPEAVAEKLIAEENQIIATGKPLEYEEELKLPIGSRYFLTVKFPIFDEQSKLVGIGAFISDITEIKRGEAERLALKEEVIQAQQNMLRELSSPLVPLAEGILAMPIIGSIDAGRAREILESLLLGISQQGAHTAILDITGVRTVDTQAANALISAARAARLLGARVILTGISPAVAQTLVQLGISLEGIVTLSSLASGINFALKR